MNRDLSPSAYVAPGPSSLGFSDICVSQNPDPEQMDQNASAYSPSANVPYSFAGSATMVALSTIFPGLDANCRWVIIIPPRGNTNPMTLKGVTGDTGIPLNPNGISVIPIPSGGAPTWGITATSAIVGVLFKFR